MLRWFLKKDRVARVYFPRRQGRDHVFLWASEAIDFRSVATVAPYALALSVEGTPIECKEHADWQDAYDSDFGGSCQHDHAAVQPFLKDIIIPGYVEPWSVRMLHDLDRNTHERRFLACYHGADSDEMHVYLHANATVRNDLQQLAGSHQDVSIGRYVSAALTPKRSCVRFPYDARKCPPHKHITNTPTTTTTTPHQEQPSSPQPQPQTANRSRLHIVSNYFERVGQCQFCLVPKGLGYWTNRLYEVMLGGASR